MFLSGLRYGGLKLIGKLIQDQPWPLGKLQDLDEELSFRQKVRN
jgi:hypothetical protein